MIRENLVVLGLLAAALASLPFNQADTADPAVKRGQYREASPDARLPHAGLLSRQARHGPLSGRVGRRIRAARTPASSTDPTDTRQGNRPY